MAKLEFDATAVLELLEHALNAPHHTSPYGLTQNPGPGLMLVKDAGIYLMSNREPRLPGTDTANKVVYARGYEDPDATASESEWSEQYTKIRDAVGGDDFAEFLEASSFASLRPDGLIEIELTSEQMVVTIRNFGETPLS